MYKERNVDVAIYSPSSYSDGGCSAANGFYFPQSGDSFQEYYTSAKMGERFSSAPSVSYTRPNLYQLGKETFLSTAHKRPRVNYCTHHKAVCLEYIGHGIVSVRDKNVYKNRVYNWRTAGYDRVFATLPSTSYYPKALPGLADATEAARRAWWTMLPRFQSESSLLLSLAELKDFKDMAHLLVGMLNRARSFGLDAFTNAFKPEKSPKSGSIDRATGTVASGILVANFALAPLLSDIANLITSMQTTVLDAQNAFIEKGTVPHTSHYTEVFENEYQGEIPYPYILWTKGFQQKTTFTASMERTYSVKPQSAFENFVKYYGLGLTFETMWNLLPFSFLTDYIFTIGKSIRAMENADKSVQVLPMTYYESLCYESTWGMHAHTLEGYAYINGSRVNIAEPRFVSGYRTSIYQRYPAARNYGPALPKFAKYRDKKLLNAVALLRVMF